MQVEELRSKFEEQAREMENRYQERYGDLRSDLGLRARTEVSHVEERKNDQIDHIKRSHEKAFNEIKNYYNDITLNNLAMIATLKEEIKERDVKIERSEKQVEYRSTCVQYTKPVFAGGHGAGREQEAG